MSRAAGEHSNGMVMPDATYLEQTASLQQPEVAAVTRADEALRQLLADVPARELQAISWADCQRLADSIQDSLASDRSRQVFLYRHIETLQTARTSDAKPYDVRLAWYSSNVHGNPLIAVGGITNVSQRFDFLADDIAPDVRLIGLDLAGRGLSGWLSDIEDYNLDSYVEQLRQFMICHGLEGASVLGSSLGGTVAIRLAAEYPDLVSGLILNDTGPYIPAVRRARRARAVARHYVFHTPADLFRRTGAAAKFTGRTPDAALLHSAFHKTKWSDEEQGRVYRHDLRALLAYRQDAASSLDIWHDWERICCPVLLLHGQLSDATSAETVTRMLTYDKLAVIRIAQTGHTPFLCDSGLAQKMSCWLSNCEALPRDSVHQPPDWPVRLLYPES